MVESLFWAMSARKNRHRPGWRFLLLSFCIRIETEWPRIWNVTTKYIASPPFGVVTNRPPMYAASLWRSIHRGAAFVKFRGTAALDKSRGWGIIGDEKGTLRQAVSPGELRFAYRLCSLQKPSPCPVAVSAFQLLNPYRD